MLKHRPWILLGQDIMTQYEQCEMEGRDVSLYKPLVDAFCKLNGDQLRPLEGALEELYKVMDNAPIKADYPFTEPSDLEGIFAACPAKKPALPPVPDKDAMIAKLKGAWNGRIAGCLLGKPVEGWRRPNLYKMLKETDNFPLRRYMKYSDFSEEMIKELHIWKSQWADLLNGEADEDDDTNYTTFALKLVECCGRDFTPDHVLACWQSWIPMSATCTAERVAYRNGAMGLLPPETATCKNPYREWIGAQIRGDYFGYINPGDPKTAADMAWRDASISHIKNGIYGEMWVAAMLAAAGVTDDLQTVIDTGLAYIPAASRLRRDLDEIIALHKEGKDAYEVMEHIHSRYNEFSQNGWCYTNSNAMIVLMALLYGEKDFGKSVCLAVHCAFDTDCNGATVGSIIGMLNADVPEEWTAPFCGRLRTSIEGYNHVDVDFMAEKTYQYIPR